MAKQQVVELSNGAILIYQKQSAFNGSSFVIGFRGGAQLDGKYEGISHLLEHLLFRPASEDLQNSVLNNILSYSINQNAYTSDTYLCVTGRATKNNFERAIDNCIAMLKPKGFTAEQIRKEVAIVKQEINLNEMEEQEGRDLLEVFLDQLTATEGDEEPEYDTILGTMKTLKTVTPELLTEYVERYFNTDNLVISITSNSSLKEITELCEERIVSQFKPAAKEEYIVDYPAPEVFNPMNMLIVNPTTKNSNVGIELIIRERDGESTDIDKDYAYDIVESYIANTIGGNLWQNLRVKQNLVYDYHMAALELGSAKFKAYGATTSAKNVRTTIRELCATVKTLADEGVPPETFEAVKKALTDQNNASLQKFKSATAMSNFSDFINGLEFVDYKAVAKHIENMTHEEFCEHMATIYTVPNVSLLVQGNFDPHKCYSIIDVEEMLGNTAHSAQRASLNIPRIEATSCVQRVVEKVANPETAPTIKEGEEYVATDEELDLEGGFETVAIDDTLVQ